MGDTGIVIARDGDSVEGGIVSIPADAAAGAQFMTTLRSFATLAGGQSGITVRDEQYAGTIITIIDLGSAEDLAALAAGLGGVPIPDDATPSSRKGTSRSRTRPPTASSSSAAAPTSSSTCSTPARASPSPTMPGIPASSSVSAHRHTGVSFLDIAAVRGLVESHLSEATPEERAEYEESIKPFLTPFDAFIAAGVIEDSLDEQHAVITVK